MPTEAALRAAVTPRTRAIILCSPSNPTGGVASSALVESIAAIAVEHGLYLVSDEIYEKLLFDGRRHITPAGVSADAFARTVVINGCSKAYAMTGWRIGYAASADRELVAAMGRLQDQSTSNPTSFAQSGAVVALNGPEDEVETMRAAFQDRRNAIVAALNAIPGVTCRTPGGAFYVFPNIASFKGKRAGDRSIATSDDLATYLLETVNVAVVPGSGFGADDYIRLSYATSKAMILAGVERISQALAGLS